jgi:hypothetical protein
MTEDTGEHNMQVMALDLLTEIRDKLSHLEKQQEALKEQIDKLTVDVDTVHKFQQSFAERLSIVEKFCVDQPLRSTPVPRRRAPLVGDDGHGE